MILRPRCGAFFIGAADLANNDYCVGFVVLLKQLQSVLVRGADDGVAANTYGGGLPEPERVSWPTAS